MDRILHKTGPTRHTPELGATWEKEYVAANIPVSAGFAAYRWYPRRTGESYYTYLRSTPENPIYWKKEFWQLFWKLKNANQLNYWQFKTHNYKRNFYSLLKWARSRNHIQQWKNF